MPFQTSDAEIVKIDPDQAGTKDIISEGFDQISQLLAGITTIDLTAESSPYVLTYNANAGEDKSGLHTSAYVFIGTPGGSFNIEHPAVTHQFWAKNDSDASLTILVNGQTGVPLEPGEVKRMYCDGTDVENSTSDQQVDLMSWIPGTPAASQIIFRVVLTRNMDFAIDLAGSQCEAITASTGSPSFNIRKNAVSIGSMDFATSATATFTVAVAQSFVPGDIFDVVAPGTPDATLANLSMTIVGTKA